MASVQPYLYFRREFVVFGVEFSAPFLRSQHELCNQLVQSLQGLADVVWQWVCRYLGYVLELFQDGVLEEHVLEEGDIRFSDASDLGVEPSCFYRLYSL